MKFFSNNLGIRALIIYFLLCAYWFDQWLQKHIYCHACFGVCMMFFMRMVSMQ